MRTGRVNVKNVNGVFVHAFLHQPPGGTVGGVECWEAGCDDQ